MRDDQHRFMIQMGQRPARLTAEQVAWLLNCQPADVPVLVAAKLLKPLGNPLPNAVKFFASADLVELGQDRNWLAKATNTLGQYWHKKNATRKTRRLDMRQDQPSLILQGFKLFFRPPVQRPLIARLPPLHCSPGETLGETISQVKQIGRAHV